MLVSLAHPEVLRGGSQQAHHELFLGLRGEPDVDAFFLAAVTPNQDPALVKPGAYITGFDGRDNEFVYLVPDYDHPWQRTGSARHIEAFADLLEMLRPDAVHFRHFLFLGADLLSLTRTVLPDCRIVFTFSDFGAICLADGQLVRLTDGSLCTQSSPVRCHQCFPLRRPDYFLLRKMLLQRHMSAVDGFVCPSRFQIEHYVTWGLDRRKLFHIPTGQLNYARGTKLPVPAEGPKNRFGFFGRFVDTKGLLIVLRAVHVLRNQGFTDFIVELNGEGLNTATPAFRQEVEAFLAAEDERPPSERIVVNNGSYQADQVDARMHRVDWCLVPSIWREVFGLVISEAWMFRRPVICSNVGSMTERVTHDVNGLKFQVGDPRALAAAIRRACTEPGLWERLSAATPDPPSLAQTVEAHRALYQGTLGWQ